MISRRFASIDALRGLAALGVVFSHISQHQSFVQTPATPFWLGAALDQACSYGRVGVTLFFVISGFCIHLRWASIRREGRDAHIDFASFWKKRFRRLYPPFFVALVFYVGVQTLQDGTNSLELPLDAYDLVSHLLMVHNFDERTIFSFNGVFWTLAIEEQLYCAYFLLLYMRSRWGWGPTLFVCISEAARVVSPWHSPSTIWSTNSGCRTTRVVWPIGLSGRWERFPSKRRSG